MSMNCEEEEDEKEEKVKSGLTAEATTALHLLHGNGVVEQHERGDFVAIQASLMNFITFDHNQWVAGPRDIA